jgi:glycosyltransferase involved in cell wall biosynthesis
MDRSEFQFSVCSLRAPEEAARFFEEKGIDVQFLSRGKFDPRTLPDLLKIIRDQQPDILHLHGYGATNFGRLAGALKGIPRIVHEHVVIEDQPAYQTLADAVLSPLTTRAIAISPTVEKFMVERRKIDPDQIDCFFYGIPLSDFTTSSESVIQRKRQELGIKPEQPIVCSVGRLDKQKGQTYLLSAAKDVVAQVPDVVFLVVGDGPAFASLKEQRDRLGLADSVIFTGHRDDVPDLLAMSDVVALPSLWEGGPITLFEAMSVGKPVVGTPVGLMPEVIEEGRTGHLVPVEDAESLAARLVELLDHPERAAKMGKEAHKAVQKYDLSNAVERLTGLYRDIASARKN